MGWRGSKRRKLLTPPKKRNLRAICTKVGAAEYHLACVFEAPAGEVPAGVPGGVPACEVQLMVDDGGEVPEPPQFEMDEEAIRRSNEQQRAAGSSAAVAPVGRGRWQRAWPGELRRPWRGLCSTRAARGPKGGPGSFLRPSDTVIAALLASAQQRAARRDLDRGNRGRWRRAAAREARAAVARAAPRERPGTESGPGSCWRLSGTVLSSEPGIGAPTGSSVGFVLCSWTPKATSGGP